MPKFRRVKSKKTYKGRPRGNSLTIAEWNHCLWWFRERCCVCGSKKFIEGDHWIARSRGGGSGLDNIVPICRRCNIQKGSSPALGWLVHKLKSADKARRVTARVEQYFASINYKEQDE